MAMAIDTGYLTTQVTSIVSQLHGLFDEIGVPSHDRESREQELFASLSDTLQSHLRRVNCEKSDMIDEAQQTIQLIKQMEASLDDSTKHDHQIDGGDLRVTFPLNRCLKVLKEKYTIISKLHRERFEQIKKLVQALESYSSHLEPSFVKVPLPPTTDGSSIPPTFDLSPSYASALDNEFTRVYEEYTRRVQVVQNISEEIVKLWAELGTPQAQTEPSIVEYYRESPEQLGLHESDLSSLRERRDKLIDEKRGRERKLNELRTAVESLWDRLGVEEGDRKGFRAANRGCGLRVINEFEDELSRLNELKRQNLHLFVEDARCRLQELWDGLYYSEEEMLDFTPAFSDVYSDALLAAHEAEIERLEVLREQRAPTLELIEKHRTLVHERDSLAASSQDASRLMARGNKGERRDPTRLLREEKMRKKIAKELPKVETELRRVLEQWEDEYGRPFLVHGERYLDEIAPPAPAKIPPRSKTPCGPPQHSRANSVRPPSSMRGGGSVRGSQPPSHAKTPTRSGTLKRNAQNPAAGNGNKSPTKIPSRAPLANMPHGNNSPDRRPPQSFSSSARSKMPPPRAPPPKMRDLNASVRQETPQNSFYADAEHGNDALSLSNSYVRSITPEDVYDDRNQRSYLSSSMSHYRPGSSLSMAQSFNPAASVQNPNYYNHQRQQSQPQLQHQPKPYMQQPHQHEPMGPPPRPASRQISNTSTIQTATSGSENWETYDSESEPEIDATDVYYAKLRATQGKWPGHDLHSGATDSMAGKKAKGIRGVGMEEQYSEGNGQVMRVAGSDGWTDDMETY
ncbi:microtubule associated protein [Blastomyces dermatitidis ER-3]|uniref:Microtubule associated protein n=1 Tax=Ajellomyces dermatitidis (strain ER-3 / ATCC MYA-2586) TaxID=559297 RepID=A0ABP2EQ93_AJEDR|nr:microtubule associated protein [Blastomyces dermatitidis ER-3]EEQ84516.2 microtubule associated protein [Blastomyces dermatitidis ER-3]